MVDINQKDRTIRVKIVYYGPALGGKTTNLRVLHEKALQSRRGEFVSVNSMQDRTILCDLLPLRTGGFRGYELKLQLLAVPGQAAYAATRRVVLRAADGVVFVANSAADRFHENSRSLGEMSAHLIAHQLDPHTIPLVFQYNKRDLPQVTEMAALQTGLNSRHVPAFPAVATQGQGVLETLSAILNSTLGDLCRRYRTMELPAGQSVEGWVKQAVAGIYGREKLDDPAALPGEQDQGEIELQDGTILRVEPSGQLRVRVTTTEDDTAPVTHQASESRSPEALAASYAEASAELGFVVSDLRAERDAAREQLADMRQALELATASPGTTEVETRLRRILQVLVKAGGASNAALRITMGGATEILTLPPLLADPLAHTHWGNAHLESFQDLAEPVVEEAAESVDLAEALRAGTPSLEAVAIVPLRSAERLLGLALLYYDRHAVLPGRDILAHLDYLARELAGPLEASAALDAGRAAQRSRRLAHISAAAIASLLARIPGEAVVRRNLDLADVLEPLKAAGITVELPPQGLPFRGDAPLVRFALAALVHLCDADALSRGETSEVSIRGFLDGGLPCIEVRGGRETAAAEPRNAELDSADAELSVVQAVVGAHAGTLASERDAHRRRLFTVRFGPA
jgi:signal recognition particle receptor subunit beta/GAF domain-containing protein